MINANDTQILRPEDVFSSEWLAVVREDETSEQFEERIVALVEDRMATSKTRRIRALKD
jgi:hypothetical protein